MMAERYSDERLLESLADGVPVDWAALNTMAVTPAEQRRVRNLRLVARLAELHRTLDPDAGPVVPPPGEPGSPPATWGHLRIVRRLSSGSFGDLYLAHDPQLQRDVALKLLRNGASDRPLDARLLAEAQTLARVRHPNVVTVHGADVRDGRAGLWMEFINGRTLEAWLQDVGPLGASEVNAIARDLCHALAAVHGAGLVHGDVKAQNVMREEGGRIVLMDFGAGQAQGSPAAAAGTPLYLAPEVLAGAPATVRSDIYSLGVLLFHLLTNRYPCYAADLDGLRQAHARGEYLRVRDLRPDLPEPLVDALERAIDPDPAVRFATAGTMELAFRERGNGGVDGRSTRRWLLAAAGAVAAALALAVAVPPLVRHFQAPRTHSIGVLPFSGVDGELSPHLLAGLSSDVLRELQRYDVEVLRLTRANGPVDPAAIERRTGAGSLLRGSAARSTSGPSLRVEVVRAGGAGLWFADYALDMAALPLLARTIARDAAEALRIRARPGAPAPGHQANYRAYDAYQRGRVLWEQRDPNLLERSLEYFKLAAELDPAFAEPWAGMADAYIAMGVPAFGNLTPLETRRLAKEAALKAIELNPNLVEAHTSLAFTAFLHDWDWTVAERRFQQALSLNPQYPLAHHWYAEFLNEMGRFEEAMSEILRAQALDPMSVLIHRDIAWHLFCQRRYDEAVAQLQETLRLDPGFTAARTLLARALAATGQYPAALAELERARGQISRATYLSFRGHIEALAGDRAAAARILSELRELSRTSFVSPYYLALIHTALGEADAALSELERSYVQQDPTIVTVNIDPRFDRLREEARFQALVARMQFPGAPR